MPTSRELPPWAVLAGGLYLGLGHLKNLCRGQGGRHLMIVNRKRELANLA